MRPTLPARPLPPITRVFAAVFGSWRSANGRKTGNELRVLCPFHADHEPSLDLNDKKGVFICRACGRSGGTLDLVIHAGKACTRREAAAYLRDRNLLW